MQPIKRIVLACLSLLAFSATTHAEETIKAYLIGNSLTMSTTLDRVHQLAAQNGVDLQFGSQVSGGKSLIRQLNYKSEPKQKWKSWETNVPNGATFEPDENLYIDKPGEMHRFGLYDTALPKHQWDAVVFQLYGGTLHDDLQAITTFIEMALKAPGKAPRFLIYSTWPNRSKVRNEDGSISIANLDYATTWNEKYTATADNVTKKARQNYSSRDYVDKLMTILHKRFPKEEIQLIPVGEVVYSLNKKIIAGKLPGIAALAERAPALVPGLDADTTFADGANVLYADAVHFNPRPHQTDSLGIFVSGSSVAAALTKHSPVGQSASPYGLDDIKDAELIKAIQSTILDTFETYSSIPLQP